MWTRKDEQQIEARREQLAKMEAERNALIDDLAALIKRAVEPTPPPAYPNAPPMPPVFPGNAVPFRKIAEGLVARAATVRDLLDPFDNGMRDVAEKGSVMSQQDLWTRCTLEGAALDHRVGQLLGLDVQIAENGRCVKRIDYAPQWSGQWAPYEPSARWVQGGPLIESNQIFLDPPHEVHSNPGGWSRFNVWTATVSTRVRMNPYHPGGPGRGCGDTPLIAAMRAIVDSFGG
jgi:hypothetical protein